MAQDIRETQAQKHPHTKLHSGPSVSTGNMVSAILIACLLTSTSASDSQGVDLGRCGTTGGGSQRCSNDDRYTCYNCGFEPCVDTSLNCWSCEGTTKCYPYDCGTYCSINPCANIGTCGQRGFGRRTCVNNPGYTCNDCGPYPCVSASKTCYSCYAPGTRTCYAYHCGSYCSGSPCGTVGAEVVPAGNATFYASPDATSWEPKARVTETPKVAGVEDPLKEPSGAALAADADPGSGFALKKASADINV